MNPIKNCYCIIEEMGDNRRIPNLYRITHAISHRGLTAISVPEALEMSRLLDIEWRIWTVMKWRFSGCDTSKTIGNAQWTTESCY